jgi:hypothetical protein
MFEDYENPNEHTPHGEIFYGGMFIGFIVGVTVAAIFFL